MEKKSGIGSGIRNSRREEINLANFSLTMSGYLSSGQLLPLVLQPSLPGVNLAGWAANNNQFLAIVEWLMLFAGLYSGWSMTLENPP